MIELVNRSTFSDRPSFHIASMIGNEFQFIAWILAGSVLQLTGMHAKNPWLRVSGAILILIALICVSGSVLLGTEAIGPGLSFYFAGIFIELCAIIYQTAYIVRFREYPAWIGRLLGQFGKR